MEWPSVFSFVRPMFLAPQPLLAYEYPKYLSFIIDLPLLRIHWEGFAL